MTPALSRQYAKLCDIADFADAGILAAIRDVIPERDPVAHAERKAWEFAMLALFLEEAGSLDDRAEVLAVGAGTERILFWLANRCGHVTATDIYGEGGFARAEADATMLADPAAHAPYPYREDRLSVRWADARELPFPDASFDVVFSLSSFEHFGAPREIARAAAEAGRVLRPGGHAVIVTECWIRRHPLEALLWSLPGRRGVDVLTARQIDRCIVRASGLESLQPLDTAVSAASWDNVARVRPGRPPEPRTGAYFPHILVQFRHSVHTSACVVMRKPR